MSFSRYPLITSLLLLITLLLAGCGKFPLSSDSAHSRVLRVTELQSLNHWLALSEEVDAMSIEQVNEALKDFKNPVSQNALFYYGALNQKLGRIDGWIRARDAFRKLGNDQTSGTNSRESGVFELARILDAHNQALINWHERHRHLQKELAESVLDREALEQKHQLLEQKVEALTDLEAVISHRKQQVIETSPSEGGD
jgi:hypothetical protein